MRGKHASAAQTWAGSAGGKLFAGVWRATSGFRALRAPGQLRFAGSGSGRFSFLSLPAAEPASPASPRARAGVEEKPTLLGVRGGGTFAPRLSLGCDAAVGSAGARGVWGRVSRAAICCWGCLEFDAFGSPACAGYGTERLLGLCWEAPRQSLLLRGRCHSQLCRWLWISSSFKLPLL